MAKSLHEMINSDPGTANFDPIEILQEIAQDITVGATPRVAACKALLAHQRSKETDRTGQEIQFDADKLTKRAL